MVDTPSFCDEFTTQEASFSGHATSCSDATRIIDLLHNLQHAQQKLLEKVEKQHTMLESFVSGAKEEIPGKGMEALICGGSGPTNFDVFYSSQDNSDSVEGPVVDLGTPRSPASLQEPMEQPITPSKQRHLAKTFNKRPDDANCFRRFALSQHWDACTAIVIVLNSLIIGLETQQAADAAFVSGSSYNSKLFDILEVLFLVWMIFEVLVNLYAQRCAFVNDRRYWPWNAFDVCLICLSLLLEIEKHAYSWASLRCVRFLRFGKILRALRVMRHLRGVHTMLISIWASSSQFLSACAVTLMFIYVTSLILVQGVTGNVQQNSAEWVALDEDAKEQISKLYGSVNSAMLMLFWTISGGMEWSVASELVSPLDSFLSFVWLLYMGLIMFGLLNVLVSIFVESAVQAIPSENRRIFSEGAAAIFSLADKDQDGYLKKEELNTLLTDPYLGDAIDCLGIREEVLALSESLAEGKRGQVSLQEFKSALWASAEGNDTALQVLMTMHESRRTSTKIKTMLESWSAKEFAISRRPSCREPADTRARQPAVADGMLVQAEPWLAAWTPKYPVGERDTDNLYV